MRSQSAQNSKTTDTDTSCPLLTVIIPVYNTATYLEKCLESVIHQTYKNLEIICVDDGSTDGSPGILAKYAERDSRITVITQANKGQASARNAGLDAATGEFVAFLDSDDYLEPFAYEHVMCYMTEDVEIVCFGIEVEYMTRHDLKKSDDWFLKIKFSGKVVPTMQVIHGMAPLVSNKIFRRTIIEKYHLRFPVGIIAEDVCFYYKIMPLVPRIYFLDEKLYHYLRREGSTTHDLFGQSKRSLDQLKIIEEVYRFYRTWNLLPKWRALYIAFFVKYYGCTMRWVPDHLKRKAKNKARKLVVQQRLPELAQEPNPTITYLLKRHPSFWDWFFSTELTPSARHYVIRIFGIKIKIRRKLFIAQQEREAAKRKIQVLTQQMNRFAEKSMGWYLEKSPDTSISEIEHLLDHSKRVLFSFLSATNTTHQNYFCLFPSAEVCCPPPFDTNKPFLLDLLPG